MSVVRHRVIALMVLLMIAVGGLTQLCLHLVMTYGSPWMATTILLDNHHVETKATVDESQTIYVQDASFAADFILDTPNRSVVSSDLGAPTPAIPTKHKQKVAIGLVQPSTPEVSAYLQNLSHQPCTSLTPWPNISSVAYYPGRFYSGYRNQMMGFTMLILYTLQQGHGQLLLSSIYMKDTYGTNRVIRFQDLWDIPHFNSFYPALPRLVDHDPILHDQFNPQKKQLSMVSQCRS